MGSIELIGQEKAPYLGNFDYPDNYDYTERYIKSYQGKYEDFDKLPKDDSLASGSSCTFFEGYYAVFSRKDMSWHVLGEG